MADDHELYRRGLEAMIGTEPDLEIVAEASTAADAVRAVLTHEPDVVLLEVRLGGQSGIDASTAIKMQAPSTRVLILTASEDATDLFKALLVGASGYLLKSLPAEQIVESVRLAHGGEVMVPPPMARHLVAEYSRLAGRSPSDVEQERTRALTERELEVLTLISHGKPNREIALNLAVSENTIKNHVRNIMGKLQVTSRTEAAMHAVRQNLIPAT
ncbi:response regulator [Knoellia aerolata]|uniref:Chemotaxis protein CheY n=1 Tax=Knoellia aerolata DSM 18566 TaxID=1385519 RepID=A0A0A0K1D7_9MICO|nr:response regulator transcription factor [Knoellia aerolata]KGN42814.1 chemotaxis protein CheY [Knoellia aerolata DSM 18566]